MISHKTNAYWESGAIPSAELVARVGKLIGELAQAKIFQAGEGLRATSEGVRVRFRDGGRTVTTGPYTGDNELPASITIVRTPSLDEAVEWATQQAEALGDGDVDIRPVTEPWDIGMSRKPADLDTRRYMILRKATATDEAGATPTAHQRAELSRLIEATTRANVHLVTERLRPSVRGRRYKNAVDGVSVFDGPFVESKELLGGYMIVSAASLDAADRWARRYLDTVDADEVDVRELED
jgi:hypothetical protein